MSKISDIKKNYTSIEKHKDQFWKSFYVLKLKIDHQMFPVGSNFSDRQTAMWWQRQLSIALDRMIKKSKEAL